MALEVPLGKAKVSVVAETEKHDKDIDKAKGKVEAFGQSVNKTVSGMNKRWKTAGNAIDMTTNKLTSMQSAVIGLGATYAAKRLAEDFLNVAASFEAMEVQLDVLTKGRGKETLDELNQWALDMPVNTQKAVDSFRLMTAMGINPTIKTLETLTDVASIFGDDVLQRLALQLGQASAKGRIMSQDLNIMAEAGINARKYLQDAYGMTVEEIQRSGMDVKEIIKTIFKGMEEEFGGSAKKMMGTWQGLTTVTKSYFVEIERSIMAAGIFEELKKELSGFNDSMRNWLENNRELIKQDVPKYIERFKNAAQTLWDVLSYDPAIMEYGLFGLLIGGRKGAVALGSLAHMHTWLMNISAGLALASTGVVEFSDIAEANFSELQKIIDDFDKTFEKVTEEKKIKVVSTGENPFEEEKERLDELAEAAKKAEIASISAIASVIDDHHRLRSGVSEDLEIGRIIFDQKEFNATENAAKKYSDFVMSTLDQDTKEYKDMYLAAEMEKWKEVEGITDKQLKHIKSLIEKNLDGTIDVFKEMTNGLKSAAESSMAGIFSDTLKGELDSFEDYFQSFTNSLISMWSQMAAKMAMEQIQASFAASAVKTSSSQINTNAASSTGSGAMAGGVWGAVAGLALAGVSKVLGDRSAEKAERERLRQLRAQTEEQITTSIAQLELSDLDYEIYQINERFENLYDIAKKTGMALDDIVKLRKLETEQLLEQAAAGYLALNQNVSSWVESEQRSEWSVLDWQREFGNLSDDLMSLDKTADDYNDKSLELLTDQFEILQNIYTIQENQLRSLESTSQSLISQAAGLQTSEGMPVDRGYFEGRYQELLDAALLPDSETNMLSTEDIAFFQSFVNDYIDTMSMLGDDYNGLIDKATTDLLSINDAVESEMEMLTKALDLNSESVDENTIAIRDQIKELQTSIEDIATQEVFDKWVETTPPEIDWSSYYQHVYTPIMGNKYPQLEAVADLMPALVDWLEMASTEMQQTEEWEGYYNWATDALNITNYQNLANHLENQYSTMPDWSAVLENLNAELNSNVDDYDDNTLSTYTSDTTNSKSSVVESQAEESTSGTIFLQPIELVINNSVLAKTMVDLSRSNPDIKRMLQ